MLFKFLSICLIIYIANKSVDAVSLSQTRPLEPSEVYTHSAVADEDEPYQYKLFWRRIGDDEIQFEAHCKTTGWVGFGLSPNGGMTDADIVIGWVKNGFGYLKDTYATGFKTPIEDAVQDYVLLDAAEIDGYMI